MVGKCYYTKLQKIYSIYSTFLFNSTFVFQRPLRIFIFLQTFIFQQEIAFPTFIHALKMFLPSYVNFQTRLNPEQREEQKKGALFVRITF